MLLTDPSNSIDQLKDISCFSWAERRKKSSLTEITQGVFFLRLKAKQVFFIYTPRQTCLHFTFSQRIVKPRT